MSDEAEAPRRGRPPKRLIERDEMRDEGKWKMRAAPNWETFDPSADETPDKLRIDPSLIPSGLVAMWVTDSVLGQAVPQHRAEFERKGWTPVHQDDFDGQFNGMWMPKDKAGEINVEGVVLMVRPKELHDRAKKIDRKKAVEQVEIKEAAMRGGDVPGVTLDPQHPSALNSNRVSKTIERIAIPEE